VIKNRTFINIYSSYSCAGNTKTLMEAIYAKESKITIDTNYLNGLPVALGKILSDNFFELLRSCVEEVLEKSNLENFNDTLLIVGSSVGGMKESEKHYFKDKSYTNIHYKKHCISVIEDFLQDNFSFAATRSVSTACTSSANALILAKRLMNVGAYKNILVVGADSLCYTTVCGFYALGVLSSKPCTPFNEVREGMNVAEGIAALLLQNKPNEQSIEIVGVGASSDAYHMTNPDPEGKGAIKAMQNALEDANIQVTEVDYINAHGTGTQANDAVEALAIKKLFNGVAVSSTKAITGHTLGAAAALEAIISCEILKRGKLPAQTALVKAENESIHLLQECQEKEINYVLSNSFAFGGNNASLLFRRLK